MLAQEMKYFAEYLSDATSAEDIDISVHCDVNIFAWLMNYVKLKHGAATLGDSAPPTLSTKNVVSILISSDFLKMEQLVQLCLKFCHDHLNVILKGPTNMNCITNKLLTRLAELFTHSELAHITDKKDKLLSKLHWKKIEQFFDLGGPASLLWSCSECRKLLLVDNHEHVACTPGRIVVDYQGQVLFNHLVCLACRLPLCYSLANVFVARKMDSLPRPSYPGPTPFVARYVVASNGMLARTRFRLNPVSGPIIAGP